MKKPASLQTVVDVSAQKRDDALRALGQAQREWQQAQVQLTQLQDYTQESQQRWLQRAGQGISPVLLATHRQFMSKLDHAIAFQNGVMERLQANIAHQQQQVMLAERELAGLNKYVERREHVWHQQLHRQEQKSNDEMAANLHRLHSQASPWKHST